MSAGLALEARRVDTRADLRQPGHPVRLAGL
jgi:hypothetical protein